MWSLYKRVENQEKENSNFQSPITTHDTRHTTPLEPLSFSNGKTQADVVEEVLKEIEKGEKLIFIKGICGTGKCLSKDTLIFCKPSNEKYFSYHSIKSLIDKHGKILSLNNDGKITESNFKNVRKTGTKKLYNLKTRTGREIIISKNHPFLTITKNGTEWQPLEKLTEKSYICLPNTINLNQQIESDENEIKVLAHLIAEGKLTDKTGSPKYYQCQTTNPFIKKDYEEALSSLFPDGKIKSRNYEVTIVFNNMDTTKGTTNKLRLFIRKHGLDRKNSSEKFIPPFIFNSKKEKISTFLKVLFSCDGSIYQKVSHQGKAKQTIIEYCSISKRLIDDISILLNIFGIQHTIISKKFRNNPKYSWRITISSQPQIKKFIENIGFIGRKMEQSLKILPSLIQHKFTNIDKVPRIIREYLKLKKYRYNQLDRYLNYEEIEKSRTTRGFKQIQKDKNILTPRVFMQSKIDFLRTHIKKINEYIKDKELNFICSENIFWDKIKSIEYLNEDETYDLEVEKYHNFIANGIIVHNSAIALNLARHFPKTSIVVPIKSLQEQYEKDYTQNKFILKKNKKPLNIAIIKGRNNFRCPFNNHLTTHDSRPTTANSENLPCTIEIREKNTPQLLQYIDKNPEVKPEEFSSASDIRRMNIAPACPYWAPLMPANANPKGLTDFKKIKYQANCGKEFALFQRKKGCQYCDQYEAYANADVLIFNSMKYQIETLIGRKPKTDLDIIDECDEFLDSFANERKINFNKLQKAILNLNPEEKKDKNTIKELIHLVNKIVFDPLDPFDAKGYPKGPETKIQKLKDSPIFKIIKIAIENPNLAEDEELNYYNNLVESARSFETVLDETYISIEKANKDPDQKSLFSRKDDTIFVNLTSINLAQKLKELIEQNNVLVMMSGTLHSEQVLKDIFGLDKFKVIEAEIQNPGKINIQKIGVEKNCSFANFKNETITRNQYLKIMDMCMTKAKSPTLIHVSAFKDLPTEKENEILKLDNLITQERLKQLQSNGNTAVEEFHSGETDILFTTKCARGIDFPGEKCNSIIITRFPYPNIQGLFWKILKQEQPEKFMEFYLDKARRDLYQKIARGIRFKGDKVDLYSPDIRVLNANLK